MLLRFAWRSLRGRRTQVLLVMVCLSLGIMARVGVGSVLADARQAIAAQARTMVGADITLRSNQPLADEQRATLQDLIPDQAHILTLRSMITMASRVEADGANLIRLRSVPSLWPQRGTLRLVDHNGETFIPDTQQLAALLADRGLLVQRDLLAHLQLELGDQIRIGESQFTLRAIILEEPGSGGLRFSVGPSVIMGEEHLAATGLSGLASRIAYETHIILPMSEDPEALAGQLRNVWELPEESGTGFFRQIRPGDELRLTTAQEALAGVDRFLNRFADFLNILSLLALLLGSVGVAHMLRGYVIATLPESALLAVLGARPGRVMAIMVTQTALLGLAGGLLGSVLGILLHLLAVHLSPALAGLELHGLPHLPSLLWGLSLGLAAGIISGLPPILALRRVRPLAVLREDALGLPADRAMAALLWLGALLVLILVAAWETRSWYLGPSVVSGALVAALMIGLLFRALSPLLSRFGGGLRWPGIRYGVKNIIHGQHRPTAAVVALGVAACTLGVLDIYHYSFAQTLRQSLHNRAPALYALEIPNDEVDRFRDLAYANGAAEVATAAMVTARLRAINGESIATADPAADREAERQHWARTREQRLSWRTQLGPDERLIAGEWMDITQPGEASVAETFAESAGLHLGDRLSFDIQGVQRSATITSIRKVDWLGFQLNFFVLLSPPTIDDAPRQWLSTIALPAEASPERRQALQGVIAREFPGVTTIDVADQVGKARVVFARMSVAVIALSLIATLAGLAVLIGICAASAHERRHDAALLRICGARNGTLRAMALAEFAVIGALAGVIGVALAVAGGYGLVDIILDLPLSIPWWRLGLGAVALSIICALTGLVATHAVRARPPLAVLRDE